MSLFRTENKEADAAVQEKSDGQGEYEGVKYEYKTCSDSWFGTYTCCVDKCFLDAPGKQLRTKTFQLSGYRWSVKLKHDTDDDLQAYLRMKSPKTVTAHCAFIVVNHRDKMTNESFGDSWELSPEKDLGCSELASISKIKDEASGFLKGGAFVIRLEIRIELPENEVCRFCTDSGILTWKIKGLYGRGPWKMTTGEFDVDGHKWRLYIHPYGEQHDGKHLGFYLQSLNDSVVRARYTLTAVNHQFSKNISRTTSHKFKHFETSFGFAKFLKTESVEDATLGFLEDEWITLTATIEDMTQPNASKKRVPAESSSAPSGSDVKRNKFEDDEIAKILKHTEEALAACMRDAVKQESDQIQNLKETLPGDNKRGVTEAIINEIREVGSTAAKVQKTVAAIYQEICVANLMLNIDLELVSEGIADLTDRDGQRVVPLSDDDLPNELVFLLQNDKPHRLRISLTHKRQGEAFKFRIHSVSVQPVDDVELDLDFTETKPPAQGNEVVSWFHANQFPRSRLNRKCSQFGSVEQKYVKVDLKIVVEMASDDSTTVEENFITINRRIWFMPIPSIVLF